MIQEKTKKVLIIDDSAVTRAVLEKIINSNSEMEVVGSAINPIIASKKIHTLKPDVITLDLVMPGMDGLTFLQILKETTDIPVIVISGNSPKSSHNAIKALELGAYDVIEKPDLSSPKKLEEVRDLIHNTLLSSPEAIYTKDGNSLNQELSILRKKGVGKITKQTSHKASKKFYAIGSSTGGPEILKAMLSAIDPNSEGIVIAQHMPAAFTSSFAKRLNDECEIKVQLAKDGDRVKDGKVLIIPGDFHGLVKHDKAGYYIELNKNDKVNRHRPSVDVLFSSAAFCAGSNATGIILTGMGSDGANGLSELHKSGALTIAQNRETCVVFGMPKQAIEIGAAKQILSPRQIVELINQKTRKK